VATVLDVLRRTANPTLPACPTAARISSAANVDIKTLPMTPENNRRKTAIQSPEVMTDHRPRAPAATLTAVCPTEPPTG
jgi:hypothetical protein